MAMDPDKLAKDIKDAIDSDQDVPPEIEGMAKDIVNHLKTGVVNHLPQTVSGTAPPSGGPLIAGAASAGTIILVPPTLVAAFTKTFKQPTPQVIAKATQISTFLMTGLVNFATGNIVGTCANTPTSPGPFLGSGQKGQIQGLAGPALAPLIAGAVGGPPTPEIIGISNAIADHITQNAEVSYAMGSVVGSCAPGGGPLIAGAGIGGVIS